MGTGSDERNEARLHGSTNGSGGADGGSDGARPGSAGAPFGRIVEPMAPNRVPKWLQNGSQKWPRRNSENCAPNKIKWRSTNAGPARIVGM